MNDLLNYFQILKRRWLIASSIFICVLFLGYSRAEKEVPLYRAKGQMLSQTRETIPYSPDVSESLAPLVFQKNLANELTLIRSENLAKSVIKDLNLNLTVSEILENFSVFNPKDTDILEFSYISDDPQKASTIVNSWMENYVKLDEETVLSENVSLKTFLEEQIPKSRKELESASRRLKSFKQNNRILDIQVEASATTSALNELAQQIDTIKVELSAEKTNLQELEKVFGVSNSDNAILSTFVAESPLAGSMLEELQKLKNEIENEKLRFGEDHPKIIKLRKKETILRRQIEDYISKIFVGDINRLQKYGNADQILQPGTVQKGLVQEYWNLKRNIQVLNKKLQSLEELYSSYKQKVDQIPELEFQQKQLEREVVAREKILANLIESNQEQQLALNKKPTNLKLVQYADIPEESFSDQKRLKIFQSIIGAVLAGSLGAYIVDRLDDKIKSLEDFQNILDFPILGRIPQFSKTDNIGEENKFSQIPVIDSPKSLSSEAFRMLFAAISFIQSQKNIKSIAISSSMPNEGKSTISANLALVGAEIGLKVLLIEADLRKPSQSSIFNIKQQKGLVDFLKGEIDIHNLPFVSTANSLDILFAGTKEFNPLSLIVSEKMTDLLAYCHKNYDLIIIDSPPITMSAESSILAKKVDGFLMVARPSKVTRSAVESSKEIIQQSELKLQGLILNCISSNDGYGYYNNYYYYQKNYVSPSSWEL